MTETTRPGNAALNAAAVARNDEFYTRRTDIENELRHYQDHFQGKVVYCNCDDPTVSEFFAYFKRYFNVLGLRRLITTCYKSKDPFGWTRYKDGGGCRIIYDGVGKPKIKKLKADGDGEDDYKGGDFRSRECLALLREADIVCTNPPFSLWRKYIAQLVAEDKQFLIIGNINAVSYREIFPLIMAGKLWLGPSITSGDREFGVPDHYPLEAANCGIGKDGKKFIRVKGVRWFTNLDHKKRHENLRLGAEYGDGSAYPKYDNYDAIEVGRVVNIPCDYAGVMGVPITFLDKWNPEQFDILGSMVSTTTDEFNFGYPYINKKKKYARLLIRNRRPQ